MTFAIGGFGGHGGVSCFTGFGMFPGNIFCINDDDSFAKMSLKSCGGISIVMTGTLLVSALLSFLNDPEMEEDIAIFVGGLLVLEIALFAILLNLRRCSECVPKAGERTNLLSP